MEIDEEELTTEQLKHFETLADAFFENLEYSNIEFGGLGLNAKRPFGNSSVEPDLAEIVFGDRNVIYDPNQEGFYDEDKASYLRWLYFNLGEYLQKRWQELQEDSILTNE